MIRARCLFSTIQTLWPSYQSLVYEELTSFKRSSLKKRRQQNASSLESDAEISSFKSECSLSPSGSGSNSSAL